MSYILLARNQLSRQNSNRDIRGYTYTLQMRTFVRFRDIGEGDCRVTVSEIAAQVGISYGSCQTIITEDLGFRKVCARWVPRLLTTDQKLRRLEVCQRLFARFEEEGDAFLGRIITCDEMWDFQVIA